MYIQKPIFFIFTRLTLPWSLKRMMTADRLHQSLHLAQISFSAMYAVASFFLLLSGPDQTWFDCVALLGCVLLWISLLYGMRRLTQYWFVNLGSDAKALTTTQRRLWALAMISGLVSVLLAWLLSFN
jgi:hypothetical protein